MMRRRTPTDPAPQRRHGWLRRAGLLVAVLALVLGGCSALTGGSGSYQVVAEFSRAYVLFPGSSVRVLGVTVGKIDEVTISEESDTVKVRLDIDGDVTLPADAGAVIIPETLLGERYVQIFPPYEGGAQLPEGGTIPVERTQVPAEFDEILESLNRFVGGLDEDEVARFTSNLAEVLDGNGEQFGRTIDAAYGAIQVLNDEDEDLIRLADRLSDLNETITSRDDEIGRLLTNYNILTRQIVDERGDLDRALNGLGRLTAELADLMSRQRPNLERDIESLTRLTRSTNRNLDQISLAILSSAELFGHAERVFNFERNMLPLVNHDGALADVLVASLEDRLVGLCLRSGLDAATCDQIPLDELVPDDTCFEPIIPCNQTEQPASQAGDGEVPLPEVAEPAQRTAGEVIRDVIETVPGFKEALRRQADALEGSSRSTPDDLLGLRRNAATDDGATDEGATDEGATDEGLADEGEVTP